MKLALIGILLSLSGLAADDTNIAPRIKDCPKEVVALLRADIRRAYLNVTFSAANQHDEDAKLDAIVSTGFGGALLTFDPDDADNEFQVTVYDGEGAKKRSMSFLYNQTKEGWELAAALPGAFPVGSPDKHNGWRDLSTREPIAGRPDAELVRTYRYKDGVYSLVSESIDSGG